MSNKGDVKKETVEKITEKIVKSSNGQLTTDQARRIAIDSAIRVNNDRRGGK